MFKFICKTLHHVPRSSQSPNQNLCFLQIQPFSSSLKPTKNLQNQHSFTVIYLINSFGFSPEKALSKSKYVKFESPAKPDFVLAFFKNHGFTQTQISTIITNHPSLLLCDPEKTLLPKLEFLKSKGVSSTDVSRIVSTSPDLLRRSLEKIIIPSFNFYNNLLQSEEKTITAMKRKCGPVLFGKQTLVTPNIEILRETGVPNANITILLMKQPRAFMTSSDRFRQVVEEVENMGFDPLRSNFVMAIYALRTMTRSTWEKKVEVYKRWGWTEDDILEAFKKHPWCMMISEDKISAAMDFLVNKMGAKISLVAQTPVLLSFSLKKRIVPRSAVYQMLLSKGLIKSNSISLTSLLIPPEKWFLEKLVNRHKNEAPELLRLYKEKLDLAK
ncbi:transcription termination factor MTERF15, mitochondrial-like [Actinidia eriantha]|uniref:transcription termination factor MTERF15, mitochondrial-like n=1 Tax=Actinidia eriantha TaxID=165200 RepID=UPI00258B8B30|nr:transcription termination factor MTERF15, mitochondrial-like [Actinidia eriantha]XP_057485672.1 transcription termination factor MTERF15, mitochondrial-like [Actinidia eriantha]XP_057485673.1 transcription termination factor MTERF15, mitochondrial-like [Actinidia eriantha]XP_057485674.1 transcription termination factor MTERF15, mitochondrial-like [Actinidia eriantha]XP_057485675.1 transcription termination factor MTERF15, mitochondrial-like [Actinidia eriantha]